MQGTKAKSGWSSLGTERQTQLVSGGGRHLERVRPTGELAVRVPRLRDWLDQRGIVYPGDP